MSGTNKLILEKLKELSILSKLPSKDIYSMYQTLSNALNDKHTNKYFKNKFSKYNKQKSFLKKDIENHQEFRLKRNEELLRNNMSKVEPETESRNNTNLNLPPKKFEVRIGNQRKLPVKFKVNKVIKNMKKININAKFSLNDGLKSINEIIKKSPKSVK